MKDLKNNPVELFSQASLLTFTKGVNNCINYKIRNKYMKHNSVSE